jgi:hypothetical protein
LHCFSWLLQGKKEILLAYDEVYLPSILNSLVPHFGQVPLSAFLPFFSFTSLALLIVRLALHLTQYASGIFLMHREASLRMQAI